MSKANDMKVVKDRNRRRWFNNDDVAWLKKNVREPRVLVRIQGLVGDSSDGEVVYRVREVKDANAFYPASDKNLTPVVPGDAL